MKVIGGLVPSGCWPATRAWTPTIGDRHSGWCLHEPTAVEQSTLRGQFSTPVEHVGRCVAEDRLSGCAVASGEHVAVHGGRPPLAPVRHGDRLHEGAGPPLLVTFPANAGGVTSTNQGKAPMDRMWDIDRTAVIPTVPWVVWPWACRRPTNALRGCPVSLTAGPAEFQGEPCRCASAAPIPGSALGRRGHV